MISAHCQTKKKLLFANCVVFYLSGPWVPLAPLRHSVLACQALQGGQAVRCCHLCLEGLEVLDGPSCSSRGLAAFEP